MGATVRLSTFRRSVQNLLLHSPSVGIVELKEIFLSVFLRSSWGSIGDAAVVDTLIDEIPPCFAFASFAVLGPFPAALDSAGFAIARSWFRGQYHHIARHLQSEKARRLVNDIESKNSASRQQGPGTPQHSKRLFSSSILCYRDLSIRICYLDFKLGLVDVKGGYVQSGPEQREIFVILLRELKSQRETTWN